MRIEVAIVILIAALIPARAELRYRSVCAHNKCNEAPELLIGGSRCAPDRRRTGAHRTLRASLRRLAVHTAAGTLTSAASILWISLTSDAARQCERHRLVLDLLCRQ